MAETGKVVPLKASAAKTKKTVAKKTAVKKTVAKKPVAKQAAPKKAAEQKVTKKPVAKKAIVKKASIKKAPVKAKTVAKKRVLKSAAPKKAAAQKVINKKSIAKKAAPKILKTQTRKATIAVKKPAQPTSIFNPMETIMSKNNFDPTNFGKAQAEAQAQFDQFTKEAANINREGMDAIVKSGEIFAKGFESIVKESISFAQLVAEKNMKLAQDALTSKTINEFSEAQNKIAQTSFDDFMSGTTKITELGVKVFSEAIEPISDQIQKSVQKATDAVAAE